MSYWWLIPFFIIGAYLAIVAGLYNQATSVAELKLAKREVWKVPFLYVASVVYIARNDTIELALRVLKHPSISFTFILKFLSERKKCCQKIVWA